MPKYINRTAINFCTVLGAAFCVLFVVYGLQHRLFTSQEALQTFVNGFGVLARRCLSSFRLCRWWCPFFREAWDVWQVCCFLARGWGLFIITWEFAWGPWRPFSWPGSMGALFYRCCSGRRQFSNMRNGRANILPSCSRLPFSFRWRRMTFSAGWREPPPCPGGCSTR